MYKYIIIEIKNKMKSYQKTIEALFFDIINPIKNEFNDDRLILTYKYEEDIDLEDIIQTLKTDLFVEITAYISNSFNDIDILEDDLSYIIDLISKVDVRGETVVLDERKIYLMLDKLEIIVRKRIFKKYSNDQIMIDTLKNYLINNQNMSLTSRKMFIHRNTLIQRLDKFKEVTNYDVRNFIDGYIIFKILMN